MPFPIRLPLTVCLAACIWMELAHGQVVSPSPPVSQESIRQASLSTSLSASPSIVKARRDASEKLQIRVTVQYLLVDSETRQAIYDGLDWKSIISNVQTPPAVAPVSLPDIAAPATSLHQIHAPSRVTSYSLSQSEFADVLKKTMDSPNSQVNAVPKIILLDGNEVEMTDLVQRPFVIDFVVEGDVVKPSMHVLEEGVRLRLVAHLTDPNAGSNQPLNLRCELTLMRVLDVKSDEVFGVKAEPLKVQVPVQQITSAVTSRQMLVNQTLLIDPHVSQSHSVQNETGVPVLSRIPYLNRAFKNVSVGTIQQHMLLLLQPSIEPMAH